MGIMDQLQKMRSKARSQRKELERKFKTRINKVRSRKILNLQAKPFFDRKITENFLTRFSPQRKGKGKRFFGSMNLLDIGNLIDGSMLGRRRKSKGKPKTIDRYARSIIG